MIERLREIEKDPEFLRRLHDPSAWKSIDIDYLHPKVERVWTEFGDVRVMVHIIHPCEDPFFHPHPWPSAVHLLDGGYEMPVGFGAGVETPPVSGRILLAEGSYYDMTDPNMWHAVKVTRNKPVLSIMVMGKPWGREMPQTPGKELPPLDDMVKELILSMAAAHLRGGFYWDRLPR